MCAGAVSRFPMRIVQSKRKVDRREVATQPAEGPGFVDIELINIRGLYSTRGNTTKGGTRKRPPMGCGGGGCYALPLS